MNSCSIWIIYYSCVRIYAEHIFRQIRQSLTRAKYFCKYSQEFIPREMNFKSQLDENWNSFAWISITIIKFYNLK